MTISVSAGMASRGFYEWRGHLCPNCGTPFDDDLKPPRGKARYCPKCKKHELGELMGKGTIESK